MVRLQLPHRRVEARLLQRQEKLEAKVERLRRRQEQMQREQRAARFETGEVAYEQGPLDSSAHLKVGRHSYIVGTPGVVASPGDEAVVRIGSFCSIAAEVQFIVGGNHRPDWVSTYPFRVMLDLPGALEDGHPATKGDIEVGHDVWIGRGARILSGVTVGNGAVVGAAAVVAGDVRPYAIVVGNPAREVRRRFGEEAIAALECIAWWDWPDERIVEAAPQLSSAQIDRFIAEHSGGEVRAQGARPFPRPGPSPRG